MLCSETDTMAAIEASVALAQQLEAAEEEGRLKRQKQEKEDEKLALGIYNCECVCSLSLSFSLSLSLCRNPNFVRGGTLIKHILAASPGKTTGPTAAAAAEAEDVQDLSHGKSPRDALAAQARHVTAEAAAPTAEEAPDEAAAAAEEAAAAAEEAAPAEEAGEGSSSL